MKVLVVGGGGREHAIAWKIAQSKQVTQLFVAPGNAGTAMEPNMRNVPIPADDVSALLAFAQEAAIDLTVVGPEAPLVLGIVDRFREAGLRCFGPSQAAAQLEGSKAFSKDFLMRHQIPTAAFGSFTDIAAASAYVRQHGAPIVVKADGLAAGKGVILAQTEQEALDAIHDMLAGNSFGEAGHRVVIEEFLQGEEASFIVMVDGEHVLPMASSQDHKACYNGDTGPNTGGMGAYSPAPLVSPALHEKIMQKIIYPTVTGMAIDGMPYTGFLYAGIMVGADGEPKVLEFNCRLGDPETQPIMMRLQSDFVELLVATLDGCLDTVKARWDERSALGVVLAAKGYPADYRKGDVIKGLTPAAALPGKVFHAGTKMHDGQVLTHGGRVLCAVGLGNTVTEAQRSAYQLANIIQWDGVYYRTDIGYRAIAREK